MYALPWRTVARRKGHYTRAAALPVWRSWYSNTCREWRAGDRANCARPLDLPTQPFLNVCPFTGERMGGQAVDVCNYCRPLTSLGVSQTSASLTADARHAASGDSATKWARQLGRVGGLCPVRVCARERYGTGTGALRISISCVDPCSHTM